MMKHILFLVLSFFHLCCLEAKSSVKSKPLQAGRESWIFSANQLGIDLFKSLNKENVCLSPFGISSALTLIYSGSAGNTQKEIAKAMHITSSPSSFEQEWQELNQFLSTPPYSGQRDLHIYNFTSLWLAVNYAYEMTFIDNIMQNFKVISRKADFARQIETARFEINRLTNERTEGKVEEMIPFSILQESDTLALANAFVFKVRWDKSIAFHDVKQLPFFTNETATVSTPAIGYKGELMAYKDELGWIIKIPYAQTTATGPHISLFVIYPNGGKEFGTIKDKLSLDQLKKWQDQLVLTKSVLILPKFHLNEFYALENLLEKLGMKALFNEQADLTRISPDKGLTLGQFFHRAPFSVTKLGTEESLSFTAPLPQPEIPKGYQLLKLDHPFLFVVQEETSKAILFLGKIVNPVSN